jgi:hypothetical protein
MKKYIIMLLLVVISTAIYAQEECPENEKSEKTLKMWQNIDAIFPAEFPITGLQNDGSTIIITLENVSDEEFERLCKTSINTDELRHRFPGAIYKIMLACSDAEGQKRVMTYIHLIEKQTIEEPKFMLKAENSDSRTLRIKLAEIEKELNKISNTSKYLTDVIAAHDTEIKFHRIEVVDNVLGLVKKNVPMDEDLQAVFDIISSEAMKEWREKEGVEASNIENITADVVNTTVETIEKGLDIMNATGYTPIKINVLKGKIPANRIGMYYNIFKSTPELGKLLAHGTASLTIYFEKRENKKRLEELNKRAKKLKEEKQRLNNLLYQ